MVLHSTYAHQMVTLYTLNGLWLCWLHLNKTKGMEVFAMYTQCQKKKEREREMSVCVCVHEEYQGVSALQCSCSSHIILKLFQKLKLKGKKGMRDFPGYPVVKTLYFH